MIRMCLVVLASCLACRIEYDLGTQRRDAACAVDGADVGGCGDVPTDAADGGQDAD